MDDNRFQQLLETAQNAFRVRGDNVSARAAARRQYQQTLDLLSVECDEEQWAIVQSRIAAKWA